MDLLRRKISEGAERRGWTLNELSQRAGLHRNALQQIMSGRAKNPRIDTIRRVAYALGDDPRTWIVPMSPKEFQLLLAVEVEPDEETP